MTGKKLLLGFAIIIIAVSAQADDRDLLRSRGAPPNVLLVVDSSGSMTRDVATDGISFIGSGDDPHSKLFEVKYALDRFFGAFPDFNMGFTFYERDVITVGPQVFLYRLDPVAQDLNFRWQIRVAADGSLVGYGSPQTTQVDSGDLLRLGDNNPNRGVGTYVFIPLFGPLGQSMHSDWSRPSSRVRIGGSGIDGNGGAVVFDGNTYTGQYRVDMWLEEPMAGTGYYYPAYDWNSSVTSAIDTFQGTHDLFAPVVFDPASTPRNRLDAFNTLVSGREAVQVVLEANQIGLTSLTLKTQLRECQGSRAEVIESTGECRVGRWVTISTNSRIVDSAGGLTPWQLDPTDTALGSYPESILPLDFDSGGSNSQAIDYNNSCTGWQGVFQSATKIPLIPIPTDNDPDMMPYMRSFLRPQPQMQMFFPTRPSGLTYWPYYWEDLNGGPGATMDGKGIWVTDRVLFGAGATPIKNSLNDAEQYFSQDIFDRDDPFAGCRKNFVILITDGLETCSGANTACVAATDMGRKDIPVFVIGYGLGTSGNDLQCIADNSDGELYLPNDVEELVEALRNVGQSIEERSRGFAAPMVPSVQTSTDQKAFLATFLPLNGRSIWQGHLRSYPVNPLTGSIPTTSEGFPLIGEAHWDAGAQLAIKGHAARFMYYGDEASSGMPGLRSDFTYPNNDTVRDKLRNYLNNLGLSNTELDEIVGFIRGDRDISVYGGEIMGDVFHGVPQLIGPPDCYPCWFNNYAGYRDDLSNAAFNDGFRHDHGNRREVLYVAADDGTLHGFDAGMWNESTSKYDDGTGDELFAWSPRAVMPTYEDLTYGEDHRWTVDGTPTIADTYIDRTFFSSPDVDGREWRSLLIAGQRRGGHSYICLDITQPDRYDSDGVPVPASGAADRRASCRTGGSGCVGAWPDFRWEFTDTLDENLDGVPDLGQTWSRPLVGFVKVEVESGLDMVEEDRSVVIFGGGFDPRGMSGRHLYIVDVETGQILFKSPTVASVPGDVAALDINLDGFLERLYWADLSGTIYRLDLTTPGTVDTITGRVTSWQAEEFFYAGNTQPLFMRIAMAPATYSNDGDPLVALAIGAGDRDDIFALNPNPHHFYVVLDKEDFSTVGTLSDFNLQAVAVDDPFSTDNFLVDPSLRGWYLVLGEHEKVNTTALIINGVVIFSTFKPGDGIAVVPDPDNPGEVLCRRSGDAKTYIVSLFNANPPDPLGDRFIQHDDGTAMATDPTVYLGADGLIHVIQGLDDLKIFNPLEPTRPSVRTLQWRQE